MGNSKSVLVGYKVPRGTEERIHAVFRTLDTNVNGQLDQRELNYAYRAAGFNREDVPLEAANFMRWIEEMDQDHDKKATAPTRARRTREPHT